MKKAFLATVVLLLSFAVSGQDLKKSVTWNNLRSHPAPLPVVGELETVPSSLDRPSFWSVGCETLDRDFAKFDNFIGYMGETGVGYARLQSGWAKCEPKKKGKYDFAWLDHQVDGLIAEGIHPWMCLCYGNPLYTDGGKDLNARLFGDGPVMDGWNEPDGARDAKGNWVAGTNWEEYALLFVRTATAIREADPEAKIAAFGAFSINKEYFTKGLEAIARLGSPDLVDYVTYHAYWATPERIKPFVLKLKDELKEFNPKAELLQGESGCPSQLEYGYAMCYKEWTEYSQVKWDLRHMLTNFSVGVPSSVFTMVDLQYTDYMLQSFGLLRMNLNSVPQYKRPIFYGIQHLTSVITADCSPCESIRFMGASTEKAITTIPVQKNGKTVGLLVWLSGEEPGSSLNREMVDISLKFPIWDAPVFLVERTEVNFK